MKKNYTDVMMRIVIILLLFFGFSISAKNCFAAAVLRVRCAASDSNTKIFIDGKYKGDCSNNSRLELFLEAGNYLVEAVKTVDGDREQTFEKKITLPPKSATTVEVALSTPHYTGAAKIRMAKEDLRAAETGSITAMRSLAQRYQTGEGVLQNSALADDWYKKANEAEAKAEAKRDLAKAKAGDISAMKRLAARYKTGDGVREDRAKSTEWLKKADEAKAKEVASADLRAAEQGDKEAMAAMIKHYETGSGVEKSSGQAEYWRKKLAGLKEAERRAEEEARRAAEEKRKAAERHELERKRAALQEELDHNQYFGAVRTMVVETLMKSIREDSPLISMSLTTLCPVVSPIYLFFDIVSMPSVTSRRIEIQKKMDLLASAWAKPDSLLAKVYRQQEDSIDGPTYLAVVAR